MESAMTWLILGFGHKKKFVQIRIFVNSIQPSFYTAFDLIIFRILYIKTVQHKSILQLNRIQVNLKLINYRYNYLIQRLTILKMNIINLNSELKFVNRIGQTLSVEERTYLQTSVEALSSEYNFEKWNFWGRIEGISKNYYVVEGVNFKGSVNFPQKKLFWSNDDFRFAQLPAPRTSYSNEVKNMSEMFTGQHQKILIKAGQYNNVVNLDGQQFKVKQKNLTELDRLSLVVSFIDDECQIVPIGAYKMIPTHELVANPDFRGLKIIKSKSLDNYLHLRAPRLEQQRLLIQCDKALERDDFMDPISKDEIKKSWSLQSDQSGTQVSVRSLLWQGYVGFHRTNSPIFGGVYMGYGIRTQDLQFTV